MLWPMYPEAMPPVPNDWYGPWYGVYHHCARCNEATLNEEGETCEDCRWLDKASLSLCARHLQKDFFDLPVTQTILSFLCPRTSKARFRRFFLRKILQGAPWTYSPFYNLFSYAGNGAAGNMSTYRDIVDHIVEYAVDSHGSME